MSRIQKLAERLQRKPNDFTWNELIRLMRFLGFELIEGRGSRVKLYHANNDCLVHLHKPHPGNILKPYIIERILDTLYIEELI